MGCSELIFTLLKCDPGTVPIAAHIEKNSNRLIFKLQKSLLPLYRFRE